MRCSKLQTIICVLLLVASAGKGDDVFAWVESLGGEVHCREDHTTEGVRGLYASEDIKRGGLIARIPATAVLSLGAPELFGVQVLRLLQEMHSPCTRFRPYLDSLPAPAEVLSACNFPSSYLHMLEDEYLEFMVRSCRATMGRMLAGNDSQQYETTLKEALGPNNVTLQDLDYVAALVTTRMLDLNPVRNSKAMVPIYDLANHRPNCKNYIKFAPDFDHIDLVAGEDLREGDEVCYKYGLLRDDYAITHYGFLPEEAEPPLLCQVDHPDFDPDQPYKTLSTEPFSGSPEEIAREMHRLYSVLGRLLQLDEKKKEEDERRRDDELYMALREYQQRRRLSLFGEMKRLKALLLESQGRKDTLEIIDNEGRREEL